MLQSQETGSVGLPLSQWLKDFIPQGKKVQVGLCAFLAVVAAALLQDCPSQETFFQFLVLPQSFS